jgi:lysylphosphatidylglycerol synthetase-like protein (DUF2156 family)
MRPGIVAIGIFMLVIGVLAYIEPILLNQTEHWLPVSETTRISLESLFGVIFFWGGLAVTLTELAMKPSKPKESQPVQTPAPTPTLKEGQKFCIFCGATIPSEAIYCKNCGKKQ